MKFMKFWSGGQIVKVVNHTLTLLFIRKRKNWLQWPKSCTNYFIVQRSSRAIRLNFCHYGWGATCWVVELRSSFSFGRYLWLAYCQVSTSHFTDNDGKRKSKWYYGELVDKLWKISCKRWYSVESCTVNLSRIETLDQEVAVVERWP